MSLMQGSGVSGRLAIIAFFGLTALQFVTGSSSAGLLQDIPEAVGDGLGVSDMVAEVILSACILLSAGMAMSVLKRPNVFMIAVVLIGLVGMLTAIGWLDGWLLIMVGILAVIMFANKVKEWAT